MRKISRRHFVQGTGAGLVAARMVAPLQAQQPGLVEERGNEVIVPGSITLSELASDPVIRGHYTALAEAAAAAVTRKMRNVGTLAEHFLEVAPALVALDGTFKIAEPSGEAPSGEVRLPGYKGWTFYTPYSTSTGGNSLRSTYRTHAAAGVAVALEMDRGVCKKARIVLGGAASVPRRASAAEALLEGKRITRELAAQAGQAAAEDKLTKTTVKRAVLRAGRSVT